MNVGDLRVGGRYAAHDFPSVSRARERRDEARQVEVVEKRLRRLVLVRLVGRPTRTEAWERGKILTRAEGEIILVSSKKLICEWPGR